VSTYLVTGGAGFIGSHLAEALVGRGHTVRVVDNLVGGKRGESRARRRRRVPRGRPRRHADRRAGRSAASTTFLHQAAIPSVPRSVADPVTSNRANITATLNLLVAARDARVKRLVYAGSSSCLRQRRRRCPSTRTCRLNPLSPYALQKVVGEQYCRMFTQLYGLEPSPSATSTSSDRGRIPGRRTPG
jgi:nucleoside-diphosphate-sugar epimerase